MGRWRLAVLGVIAAAAAFVGRRTGKRPQQPTAVIRVESKDDRGPGCLGLVSRVSVVGVVAFVSLLLSVYNWAEPHRTPGLVLTLPVQVRAAQGPERAWLVIQPRLISPNSTNEITVITGIDVTVQKMTDVDQPVTFRWREEGTWTVEPGKDPVWRYLADPGTLAVTLSTPQQPIALFQAGRDWEWSGGHYHVIMTVQRTATEPPVRAEFDVVVDVSAADRMLSARGAYFAALAISTREPVVSEPSRWQWRFWEW